ncbi:MAG: hypothetical protein NVS2B5_19540 [Beijerinckiaceae bacterium]
MTRAEPHRPPRGDVGARAPDLVKDSPVIASHRTSISLERAFWEKLQAVARKRQVSIASLVARIDAERGDANLSSALRVFVLAEAANVPGA